MIGGMLVASVAYALGTCRTDWDTTALSSSEQSYALGYAHLAELPRDIVLVHESRDGWHFVTLQFRALSKTVNVWVDASPSLRARSPVVDSSGGQFFPCTHPPPADADPDTAEGDCTRVSISKDRTAVTIHLVIPPSAYTAR
jgi:hypothetical protein